MRGSLVRGNIAGGAGVGKAAGHQIEQQHAAARSSKAAARSSTQQQSSASWFERRCLYQSGRPKEPTAASAPPKAHAEVNESWAE